MDVWCPQISFQHVQKQRSWIIQRLYFILFLVFCSTGFLFHQFFVSLVYILSAVQKGFFFSHLCQYILPSYYYCYCYYLKIPILIGMRWNLHLLQFVITGWLRILRNFSYLLSISISTDIYLFNLFTHLLTDLSLCVFNSLRSIQIADINPLLEVQLAKVFLLCRLFLKYFKFIFMYVYI